MSSRRCAVSGCLNGVVGVATKSLFKVSGKRRNYESWKKFCCNEDVTKYSYVCADHFADSDFVNKQNHSQGLKPYAEPTLKGPLLLPDDTIDDKFVIHTEIYDDSCDTVTVTPMEITEEKHELYCDPDNVAGEVVLGVEEKMLTLPPKKRKLICDTFAVDHDHNYKFDFTRYVLLKEEFSRMEEENRKLKAELRKKNKTVSKKSSIILTLRNEIQKLKMKSAVAVDALRDPLLVELQKNKDRKIKGARYSDSIKNMALVLHYCSPKAYRQMRKFFRLPSVSAMKKWLAKVEIKDGFSDNILKLLKIKSSALPEEERLVTLFLDEMAITEKITYIANSKPDYFLGFPTMLPQQEKHDVNVRAKSCLTLMIKTMRSGFKQAIGYFFCCNMDAKQLAVIVNEALEKVKSTGFIPKAVVCDQNSTNRSMFANEFKVSDEKPYFEMDGEKIYCFYDAPHLHKSIRNNLLRHNAVYKDQICSFDHIVDLYWEDVKTHPRSVPGLKYQHIKLAQFAEMNVGLAAQTLSQSVAAGLRAYVHTGKLTDDSLNTARYCEEFDQLFDIANSSTFNETKELKRPMQAHSNHLSVMQEMKRSLQSMYFVDKKCTDLHNETKFKPLVKQSRKPYCIEGWLLYISAVSKMWEELQTKYKFTFLRTRNLSQDCLEHFFSTIRWKNVNNNHPDAAQFMSAFKAAVINQIMLPKKIGNVEPDLSKFIINESEIKKIGFITKKWERPRNVKQFVETEIEGNSDMNQLSSIYWTTGWACSTITHKECLDRLSKCDENIPEHVAFLSEFKKYSPKSKIVVPGNIIYQFFKKLSNVFENNFQTLLKQGPIGVKAELMEIIEMEFNSPNVTCDDSNRSDNVDSEDNLVLNLLCADCAVKITDRYLNMLIGCQLSEMNSMFKSNNDKKKAAKKNAKAKKLNIMRPSCVAK